MSAIGIFILSSDIMYDMTLAFFESFRSFNPDIPIMLIPYDGEIGRLRSLARIYDFAIYEDSTMLRACDELSLHFHETPVGQYRKLLAWSGPYEHFIYIDIDTLVLHSVEFLFDLLHDYDLIVAESNLAGTNRFTWKKPPDQYFSRKQIEYAANTGFMASRRGVISLAFALEHLAEAIKIKDYMELICTEQPLLNFLFIRANLNASSLLTLSGSEGSLPQQVWGGSLSVDEDNNCDLPMRPYPILIIHWAGVWRNERHRANVLWSYYSRHGELSVKELMLSETCSSIAPCSSYEELTASAQ